MAEDNFHQIDPNGDVVLILHNPGAPFAVWETPPALDITKLPRKASIIQTRIRSTHIWTDWNQSHQFGLESLAPPPPVADDSYEPSPSRKDKKKKKKARATLSPKESASTVEAPTEYENEVPSGEFTFSGPSFSRGNHASIVLEVEDAAEVAEASAEPQPEVSNSSEPEAIEPEPEPEPEPEVSYEPVVKYLVSSRHLALASRYFSAKLSGPWIEAAVKHIDGCYHMDATDWDSEALLILMQVIHGKTRSVPRRIDLGMLAKLAVLVDYYDCHEVIEIYCPVWIESLRGKLPAKYGRDMVLWLLISHVFQNNEIFQQVTKVVVLTSAEPIRTMELPIPSSLVNLLDSRRQDAVEFIFGVLQKLLDAFRKETAGCSFECSSILLGSLTKEMDKHKLLDPKPAKPYSGYSIVDTENIVRAFRSPQWSSGTSYGGRHACTLRSMIVCYLNADFDKSKQGFKLSETRAVLAQVNGTQRREKGKAVSLSAEG